MFDTASNHIEEMACTALATLYSKHLETILWILSHSGWSLVDRIDCTVRQSGAGIIGCQQRDALVVVGTTGAHLNQ